MKNNKNIFAEAVGILYVRADAVMHPLFAMWDGIPRAYFGTSTVPGPAYITVESAIKWCKKEVVHAKDKEKFNVMISVMERAKAQEAETALTGIAR